MNTPAKIKKPKLKLDNEPAKLMSLDEIYAKSGGFPFQAMKVLGVDSGSLVCFSSKEEEGCICKECRAFTESYIGHNDIWCPTHKNWLYLF